MQVDMQDELLDSLLKSAVIATGVPYTYVDATNDIDFARSLAMQNQGFVKKVVLYQQLFGKYFTNIVRKMYEFEFGTNDADKKAIKKSEKKDSSSNNKKEKQSVDFDHIEIRFPAPVVLNITTINEQIDGTNTTIEYVTGLYFADDADENTKREFKKSLAREVYMQTLDWEKFDDIFKKINEDINENKMVKAILKGDKENPEDGSDMEEEPMY